MANRMISYGYGIKNGSISIIDDEARIVKRIFDEYIDGRLLRTIAEELAEEGVEFYMGNCIWNKNRVARIIKNEKYIGADGYPQIIDDDDFIYAKQLKESKGAKKQYFDAEIEYLRNNKITCKQCGKPMRRISKWRSREKWLCRGDCKNDVYVSDAHIFGGMNAIIRKICNDPDCLQAESDLKENDSEIKRSRGELSQMFNSQALTFSVGKKLIFHLAELKFEAASRKAPDVYTRMLIEECARQTMKEKPDKAFMEKYIEKISIDKSGDITIKFINGAEITS